jgi:predicted membrane chloride channel (bestrophin family)
MPFGYVAALRGFLLLFLVTIPFTMIGSYHGFAIFGEALIAYIFLDLVSSSLRINELAARSAD